MADATGPIQDAIYSLLSGDPTLSGLATGGVLDHVPQDNPYPYVVVGFDTSGDESTMGKDGQVHRVNLNVWSRYRGKKEAQDILSRIHDLLHKARFGVTGFNNAGTMYEFGQVLQDGDGLTYHGVSRYRVTTFEV